MYVILTDETLEHLQEQKLLAETRYSLLLSKKDAIETQCEAAREEVGEVGKVLSEARVSLEQCARNVCAAQREMGRELLRLLKRRDDIAERAVDHERIMLQARQRGEVATETWHRLCAEAALHIGHHYTEQIKAVKQRTQRVVDVSNEAAQALSRARNAFCEARTKHARLNELREEARQRFYVAETARKNARRKYNNHAKALKRREQERVKKLARWAGVPERYLHQTLIVEGEGTTLHFYFGPTIEVDRRLRPNHGHIVVRGNVVVYRRFPGQKRSRRHGDTLILLPKLK